MSSYDLLVIGAGIMGATAALRAAQGGMRVIVVERDGAGSGASGVNAGTLSLQIKRVRLMPYALRGHEWWCNAGDAVGFKRTGGYTLAFNAGEQALLEERMTLKRAAGAPIEFVSPAEVRAREPALTERIVAASFCAQDGHADSTRTGAYLRSLLRARGVELREHSPAQAIDVADKEFRVSIPGGTLTARRLLIASGAWTAEVAALLGVALPIEARINTVSVTEPGPQRLHAGIGHATGLLTLKQKANGSYLIGGGWQGRGKPANGRGEVAGDTLLQNLQLARYAVPALAHARVLRSWTGFEAYVADHYPLAGALPGVPNAYVLACVRGGYTIGPCIGPLVADLILGREPELPLFDPSRVLGGSDRASPSAPAIVATSGSLSI
jgi:glycine/D-amino acid oxidase-like deaminating enzyme